MCLPENREIGGSDLLKMPSAARRRSIAIMSTQRESRKHCGVQHSHKPSVVMSEGMSTTRNPPQGDSDNLNDILSQSTQLLLKVHRFVVDRCCHNKLLRVLLASTQPIHLLAVLLTVLTGFMFYPRTPTTASGCNTKAQSSTKLLHFVYLTSVALHMGAQFWMTFVSGLSLYFTLPRHSFGAVQRVLFPQYFLINAVLSAATLLAFVQCQSAPTFWEYHSTELLQICVLTTCFLMEALTRQFATAPLLDLMQRKNALETAAGSGWEVGSYQLGALAHCPHYQRLHRRFRKLHMLIAFGNVYTMACSVAHVYYLSTKFCL